MPHHGRTLDSLKQWEARFDPITRLVWSTNREVRLTDQAAHIAQLMRAAMNHVAALVAFDCALYLEPDRSRLQREIILDQAIALGSAYTPIVDRLKNDFYYMEVFVKAVEQRNANLRTNMKKYTDSQVVDEFKLVRGECEDHVKALLVKQAYAYPGDILQGTLDGKNPFYRALVIRTLQIHFFTSTAKKPSVSSMFPERFTSSDRYKADELEIPIPMLALTCAMIKLSLDLWRNGRGPTVKEDGKRNRAEMFALTACREEYTKVLELIDDIREGGPRMYHRVMHDVYLSACGSSPIVRDAKRDDDPRNRAVSRVIFDPED
ncbi:hypothetical protein PsYK624_106750 [Phanerochaete sordida]|uniref:DUF6532 domain-containing protein n=1 Tax=Phanerochaete sordida TaxID=48140 RepID=A0A9P3GGG7_9APHY|nr:hypothetical protein PsYK624_106750 [Phanerochaete sordida]